ncbi:MAG: hypothetical protein ACRD3W_14470 [Terriglobales bacterium]
MTQEKHENKVTLSEVLQLASQLSPEEQGELRRKLDESWSERWDEMAARVQERCDGIPPLSDEEIMAEVKAVREERKARRAKGSH